MNRHNALIFKLTLVCASVATASLAQGAVTAAWTDGVGNVSTPVKVGVGTATPAANLQTNGQNGVLFTGLYSGAGVTPLPASGAGTRMMWLPEKSAFRVGTVSGTQWDKPSIGLYSTALGYSTTASGNYSTAMGVSTTASGTGSTALGWAAAASGRVSTTLGHGTTAPSYGETAVA